MQTGDDYFDSKEFRDLLMSYEESIRSGQHLFMDADDLIDIADYYNLTGKTNEADATIEFALDIYPGATLPLVFKARQALVQKDIKQAEMLAEEIYNKEDPDYKYLIAEIFIAQSRISEADQYLKTYYKDISFEEQEDFIIDVANIYIDYELEEKALEWMLTVPKPQSCDFKELLARIFFGLTEYEESIKIINSLIDINPYNGKYWIALASAQFMMKDYNAAITSSEFAIAINPDDQTAIISKADGLYKIENYEEALLYYKRYCDIVPNDEFGELQIASCYQSLGKNDEALTHLKRAISIAPPDSPHLIHIHRELAFAHSAKKETEKFLEHLKRAEQLGCDRTEIQLLKGHLLLENGYKKEALEAFKKALAISDNAKSIFIKIIVSLYDNKYINLAYKMFKSTLDPSDEEETEGFSYMALCCWNLKKTEEFTNCLEIAVKRNPEEAKRVLGILFPENMQPSEFYNYFTNRLNNN